MDKKDIRTGRLLLCTGNPGKAVEMRAMAPGLWEVCTLAEVGLPVDLPETGDTLEANALEKARHAHSRTGMACLADDTGLEVFALDGEPGVRSARYAGPAKDPVANMQLLLERLQGRADRRAQFRTVLALVREDGSEALFEGVVKGTIASAPRGNGGFGYDPLFVPEGEARTFAELSAAEKNRMSHRARAVQALVGHLQRD